MAKSTYVINDNSQYRDYLSKTGTMFGLYPTNQNAETGPDGAIIYRPMHDYTSTLHPQNRPFPHIVEVVSLPPGHHQQECQAIMQDDISMDGSTVGPCHRVGGGGGMGPDGGPPVRHKSPSPHNYTSTKGQQHCDSGSSCDMHMHPHGSQGNSPREHIYELPNFPDKNRARSADSGLAHSLNLAADQTNHRTT